MSEPLPPALAEVRARLRATMRCLCLLLLAVCGSGQAETGTGPLATIIIDDLGYNRYWGERVIDLPGPITCAVLPHSPNGKRLARAAHARGKEVILHAPMANTRGRPLGPGAMTEGMSELELLSRLLWNLAAVPYASGINNHMGSLLTQREEPMGWVMRELKRHDLFFVDSRTTGGSVAAQMALRERVPYAVRDVFLDHDRSPERIEAAFQRMLRIAREKGRVVAIGHPHPETVRFLETALPRLAESGIGLIPASRMALLNIAAKLQQETANAQARASALE